MSKDRFNRVNSTFSRASKKASKTAKPAAKKGREDGQPESRNYVIPDDLTGKAVTIGFKGPDWLAHFWTIKAKTARKSLTGVMIRALVEEFGAPDTPEADEFLRRYLEE